MAYDLQVIGTVIASILTYDQLCHSIGENSANPISGNSYAPCDGRTVAGSRFANITGGATPDLRGKFLRGVNDIYNNGAPAFDPTKGDPSNRPVNDYQQDAFASHSHLISGSLLNCGQPPAYEVINNTPAPTYSQSTASVGGPETRPKNVSVYYYIKIN